MFIIPKLLSFHLHISTYIRADKRHTNPTFSVTTCFDLSFSKNDSFAKNGSWSFDYQVSSVRKIVIIPQLHKQNSVIFSSPQYLEYRSPQRNSVERKSIVIHEKMYNHQSLSLTWLVSAPLAENQIGLFVAFSFIKPDLLVGYQCCFVFRLTDAALAKGQF